jgi:hypothetical protein
MRDHICVTTYEMVNVVKAHYAEIRSFVFGEDDGGYGGYGILVF